MQGRTPLHLAAFENDVKTLDVLLRYGADATARDTQVCTCRCMSNVRLSPVSSLQSLLAIYALLVCFYPAQRDCTLWNWLAFWTMHMPDRNMEITSVV